MNEGRVQLKVSGVTDPQDARRAVDLGADLIGVMFWSQSPRKVDIPRAWEIRQAIDHRALLVGIFVNTPRPLVQRVARQCGLDMVQFFGRESRADLDHYGSLHAFKAVTVEAIDQVDASTRPFVGGVHLRTPPAPALLLHLADGAATGWTAAAAVAARAPILLASDAMGPATIGRVLAEVKPWGIDIWQAVEREPGRLDADKLAALTEELRRPPVTAGPAA